MAGNANSAHRRNASAVSSVDGAASHNGSEPDSPASASTVPTARSTPFIGPQNHPGIAPQHHPNPLGQSLNNGDIPDGDASQLGDSAFASQLEEVQTQIRMLGSNGPHPPTRNSRYRANLTLPPRADGVDLNELRTIEAEVMFAEYYYHYDPADGPFPASNTPAAIRASGFDVDDVPWGPLEFSHDESDTEENNERIAAEYEKPLFPYYPGSTSSQAFLAATFDRAARPGTFAGMAIRDASQPTRAPPIMRTGPRFSADAIAEMRSARAAASSPTTTAPPNDNDPYIAALIHAFQTQPAPASAVALSREVAASSSAADDDTVTESPIFPANWITHTNFSAMHPQQQAAQSAARRRTSRRYNDNYTTSPPSNQHTEEGDDA
ncbi:hypothetical protein KCU65_g968, partial [Aureobasidium melanogenum]